MNKIYLYKCFDRMPRIEMDSQRAQVDPWTIPSPLCFSSRGLFSTPLGLVLHVPLFAQIHIPRRVFDNNCHLTVVVFPPCIPFRPDPAPKQSF